MKYDDLIDQVTLRMMGHDSGSAQRIQHFIKVHRFAQLIGRAECVDAHTQFVLECAALVHDIGDRTMRGEVWAMHRSAAGERGAGLCG